MWRQGLWLLLAVRLEGGRSLRWGLARRREAFHGGQLLPANRPLRVHVLRPSQLALQLPHHVGQPPDLRVLIQLTAPGREQGKEVSGVHR
eukprot:1195656-Prorocentrum_minimum.AAC.5